MCRRRVAFLRPSVRGGLRTRWLSGDLARRLWGRHAVPYAVFGLFVCVQFALQAKRAQIDTALAELRFINSRSRHALADQQHQDSGTP